MLAVPGCGEIASATIRIKEADLQRARNTLLVRLATAKEKPFTLAQAIAGSLFDHGVVRAPEDSMRLVEAVTTDDVQAAAAIVARSNPTVSLVGPVRDVDYHGQVRAALA